MRASRELESAREEIEALKRKVAILRSELGTGASVKEWGEAKLMLHVHNLNIGRDRFFLGAKVPYFGVLGRTDDLLAG